MINLSIFSPKQITALCWWHPDSLYHRREAVIFDGAVRSGKTLCMGLSFFLWASFSFAGERFGLCAKTLGSLRRNMIDPVLPLLSSLGLSHRFYASRNLLVLEAAGMSNEFYCFGGVDARSAAFVQGITLAGALLDEVALMPRAFVEQVCARCSVDGSRIWFSCNPEGRNHWFYREWIQKKKDKNVLYLHFTMDDNPSLSPAVRARYHTLYSGVFYRRFILGEWGAAEGLIYDFFNPNTCPTPPDGRFDRYVISCDYGTRNPLSLGFWGHKEEVWYRLREFYYAGAQRETSMTDEEYADALLCLAQGESLWYVVVDPSASSFIEALKRRGLKVRKANNDVLTGLRRTAALLREGRIVICNTCRNLIREMGGYVWADNTDGFDRPRKVDDHAADDLRYFAMSLAARTSEWMPRGISLSRHPQL